MLGTRSSAARRHLTSWKMTARSLNGAPGERGQLSLKLKEPEVRGGHKSVQTYGMASCPFPSCPHPSPGPVLSVTLQVDDFVLHLEFQLRTESNLTDSHFLC